MNSFFFLILLAFVNPRDPVSYTTQQQGILSSKSFFNTLYFPEVSIYFPGVFYIDPVDSTFFVNIPYNLKGKSLSTSLFVLPWDSIPVFALAQSYSKGNLSLGILFIYGGKKTALYDSLGTFYSSEESRFYTAIGFSNSGENNIFDFSISYIPRDFAKQEHCSTQSITDSIDNDIENTFSMNMRYVRAISDQIDLSTGLELSHWQSAIHTLSLYETDEHRSLAFVKVGLSPFSGSKLNFTVYYKDSTALTDYGFVSSIRWPICSILSILGSASIDNFNSKTQDNAGVYTKRGGFQNVALRSGLSLTNKSQTFVADFSLSNDVFHNLPYFFSGNKGNFLDRASLTIFYSLF